MNERHIVLDVSKTPECDHRQMVVIAQGDVGGTTIVADIHDNGIGLDLTDLSARFCMRMPRGRTYVRDADCTVSDNTVTYVVNEDACAAIHGVTEEAYFEIVDATNDVIASTNRFPVHILRSAVDGAEPTEAWDSAVEELIDTANAVVDDIEASKERGDFDAEFVGVTVSVGTGSGTPTGSATLGGTHGSQTIEFVFDGLKGAQGEQGPAGPESVALTNTEIDNAVATAFA